MNVILNVVFFQITWMACVGGAAAGMWWLGPLILLAFCAWQLSVSRHRLADVQLMLIAGVIGMVADTLLVQAGLLRFAAPVPWPQLAPIWIIALWMAFALTLNHSLAALRSRLWLAAAFGLVGGPLAYWIAIRVWAGAEFSGSPMLALLALALIWAVVTPVLLMLATRLSGPLPSTTAAPNAH